MSFSKLFVLITLLYLTPEGDGGDFAATIPPDPGKIAVEAHEKKVSLQREDLKSCLGMTFEG